MKTKITVISIGLFLLPLIILAQMPSQEELEKDPNYVRHEYAKRGNHKSEMNVGVYTIIGSSTLESGADSLLSRYQAGVEFNLQRAYLTKKNQWLVYILSKDVSDARETRKQLIKQGNFTDIWLLIVKD